MKRIKNLLCILMATAIFSFDKNVVALKYPEKTDPVVVALECNYSVSNNFLSFDYGYKYNEEYLSPIKDSNENTNYSLKFNYSQVDLRGEKNSDSLLLSKKIAGEEYLEDIEDMSTIDVDRLFLKDVKKETSKENMLSSFSAFIKKNVGIRKTDSTYNVCPKYIVKISGLTVKFTDEDNLKGSEFCGNNMEYCKNEKTGKLQIGTLHSENVELAYPKEDIWTSTSPKQSNEACSEVTKTFVISGPDSDGRYFLQAQIYRPGGANGDKNINRGYEVVTIGRDYDNNMQSWGTEAYQSVKDLVINNKISRRFFTSFNSNVPIAGFEHDYNKKYVCNWDAGTFIKKKQCVGTVEGFDASIKGERLTYDSAFEHMEKKIYAEVDYDTDVFKPINFSGYSLNQLMAIYDELYLRTNGDFESFFNNFMGVYNKYEDAFKNPFPNLGDKYLCQSAAQEMKEKQAQFDKEQEAVGKRILSFKEQLSLLADEMEKKGASEDVMDFINAGVDASENFSDELESLRSKIRDIAVFVNVSLNFSTSGCNLITSGLADWIQQAMNITKICALMLALILGMVDFFRGMASGSADTMKKVWTNFSRRLIVVVILFLLPVILEFILGLVNINGVVADNPLCGLK